MNYRFSGFSMCNEDTLMLLPAVFISFLNSKSKLVLTSTYREMLFPWMLPYQLLPAHVS